ncbi:MAG: exostosin family protein [Chlamydiales bacterium]|nr:exostosin family protein [Chlamydiales bacterium]
MKAQKWFLFSLLIFSSWVSAEMQMHQQLTKLFQKEPVPTEETAYLNLLKKPVKGDYTYVTIPWVVLLNHKKMHLVKVEKVTNGFTVCQHIHFRHIIPILKEMGVSVLFTPHAVERNIAGIDIVPFPHVANNGAPPAKVKDIWFSFIGRQTHPCRGAIFRLPRMANVVIQKVSSPFNNKIFKDILSRSRFSLCPRGTGPSSIRFWESLQAGAIPVLIADAMTLPSNFDWERCVINVPESKIATIPSVLKKISKKQEIEMRSACLEAYQLFSEENFTSIIHHYFDQMELQRNEA